MEKPKFVYVTYIHTTPEKLWAALTQPEFTRQYWFDSSIESDWKPGGPIRFRRDGHINHDQIVLQCEPPRRLAYTWHPIFDEEMRSERPSRVTLQIDPMGEAGGTGSQVVRLTVTHDDFAPNSVVFPGISEGWPAVLSNLKSLLESGHALPMNWKKCGSQAE